MLKAMDKWLCGYLRSVCLRPRGTGPVHLVLCVADHFEPFRGNASRAEATERVARWVDGYADSVAAFRDSDGVSPQHTFFYPEEEYDEAILNRVSGLCQAGHGEVEIHLHHRHDTPEGFHAKLVGFRDRLREGHGLLGDGPSGGPAYGFIHGNWALCNARPDGDWCGVNDELGILADTGCYADFTFPSAPSPTQPRMVNAIYRARDRGRPRAADRGERVAVRGSVARDPGETIPGTDRARHSQRLDGVSPSRERSAFRAPGGRNCVEPSSLMLLQGPLGLNWTRRKWGILPRVENGELTGINPPTPERVDLWQRQQVHVLGRPDWVFIKLHTHGCVAANASMLLGPAMRRMHEALATCRSSGHIASLHYVTAREMVNIVRAAEDGRNGNPGDYRDYEIVRPPILAT